MSSSYHVLCVSHTPALEVADSGSDGWIWNRPEPALAAITDHSSVLGHHRTCDLIVYGNYGQTFYCPPNDRCEHTEPAAFESQWITLAVAAIRHPDLKERVDQLDGCWNAARIRSLSGYFDEDYS
jgi:hypothetical protein